MEFPKNLEHIFFFREIELKVQAISFHKFTVVDFLDFFTPSCLFAIQFLEKIFYELSLILRLRNFFSSSAIFFYFILSSIIRVVVNIWVP